MEKSGPDPLLILRVCSAGFWCSRALSALAELRLIDAMGDAWWREDELGSACNLHERGVEVLCRFAVAVGLMQRGPDGRVRRSETARYLDAGSTDYIGAFATISTDVWDSFAGFTDAVVHGPPLATAGYFDGLRPAEEVGFFETMERTAPSAVLREEEIAGRRVILDIGCGPATLTRHLLRDHHGLRAILVDTQSVLEMTARKLVSEELSDRCALVPGSFWEIDFPRGVDVVLFSRILHDWPDHDCEILLAKATGALGSTGTIAVVEEMIHDPAVPDLWATLLDLFLFCRMGEGRTRTVPEIRALLGAAGCMVTRTERLDPFMSVVVAQKA